MAHPAAARDLGPGASVAAFPLGGIGTGNVSLGSRGELRDWEISNGPDKGSWLPFTFFAIRVQPDGGQPCAKVLEASLPGPHEGDSGYHIGKVAGLPRMLNSTLRGEYPIARVDFEEPSLPVEVSLTAYTPLVVQDADDSGIPGAVLTYRVTNTSDTPVTVHLAAAMSNPLGIVGRDMFKFPRYAGTPSSRWVEKGSLGGLVFSTGLEETDPLFGSAVLATAEPATATGQWLVDFWQDGIQLFWDRFVTRGDLEESTRLSLDGDDPAKLPKLRTGSLSVRRTLAPGEAHDFAFYLAWHVPNRIKAWNGMVGLPNTHEDETVRNHYAARYEDAWAVADDLLARHDTLEKATRSFHDALFDSSLPPEVVDATASTLVTLRSTTCFRLDDGTPEGRFAAWEGSFDHQGSCEGTCTHVWNYAQTVAQLFPSLERNARRNEFLNETLPDGRMRFRTNSVFDADPLEFHPAVDGQMGTIVRLYREWRFSGDDSFLTELWPAAKRALDYAFVKWDSNGDGVLDAEQHNTYDIEFWGENSLGNSMFLAALAAGARMADHLGDREAAARYSAASASSETSIDRLLFNGEYYQQNIADVDSHRYQYGQGCLSDQLFGQTLAHIAGLGHILPADHVRSAVRSIFEHNFRQGFRDYASIQRTYALNDESGLILCSWPRGGRPKIPFVYSDEVWTGIEYQVATNLIYEGLVDEGLAIVRGVRDRYDGVKRNPWNEVECGNHYARSMASWGVLLALTGVQWDAPTRTLAVSPAACVVQDGRARFVVCTGSGWGTLAVSESAARLDVLGGTVAIDHAEIHCPGVGDFALATPQVADAGNALEFVTA